MVDNMHPFISEGARLLALFFCGFGPHLGSDHYSLIATYGIKG